MVAEILVAATLIAAEGSFMRHFYSNLFTFAIVAAFLKRLLKGK